MRVHLSLITSITALLLVLLCIPVAAQYGVTPGYDLEFSQFLQEQGERIQPSVVVIETRFTRTLHEEGREREITLEGDFATGFIYNRDGIVVTQYDAVIHPPSTYFARTSGQPSHEADYILVRLADGRTYTADIVGLDGPTRLAVLKMRRIDPEESVPIPVGDSSDVIVGEPILFIGYNWLSRSRVTYDFGVISALRPKFPTIEESTNQYFQVNVPQNYGNRGGVVVNSNGNVIAIMTDVAPYPDATEIHFALPIDVATEVVDAILDVGEMHRPWFGWRLLEMNPQIERAYSILDDMDDDGLITDNDRDLFMAETGIDLRHALFVIYVSEDSPAEDAGLREADILMEFNGVPVTNIDELSNQIERYRIGDRVTVEWMRREYAVWDPYIAEITIEYAGQREEEEEPME
jgi:serine protease Do